MYLLILFFTASDHCSCQSTLFNNVYILFPSSFLAWLLADLMAGSIFNHRIRSAKSTERQICIGYIFGMEGKGAKVSDSPVWVVLVGNRCRVVK